MATEILGYTLDDWKLMPPSKGWPLPKFLNLYWPWVKTTPGMTHKFSVGQKIMDLSGDVYTIQSIDTAGGYYNCVVASGYYAGQLTYIPISTADANYTLAS